jgi:hypothetical protein
MPITAKLDVLKIDKTKLFKGEKGTYLDIVLIESPNSAYGDDYMVVQSVTKEEREAGVKGAILGNAKIRGQKPSQAKPAQTTTTMKPPVRQGNSDEEVSF